MRAGTIRANVEFVFNGSRFKLYVPSENCHIVFALEDLRCPQPSPAYAALANRARGKLLARSTHFISYSFSHQSIFSCISESCGTLR